jgi:endoglucanase
MNRRDQRAVEVLRDLGSRPAVPFYEDGPAQYLLDALRRLEPPTVAGGVFAGVDVSRDAYGNIVAHYANPPKQGQPPVAFVAHMDHPGFEITGTGEDGLLARALGGVPVASLRKPTPVLILTPDGERVLATTAPVEDGQAEERTVLVRPRTDVSLTPPLPVVFDLPDFELDGETIRMRALDDLAGCAAILAAFEQVVLAGVETDLYAVFTRAEEAGLYGARLMAEAGTLPPDTIVVSVESSAVIPGVSQGEGPVIRTGDASYTFDADAEQVLIAARESIRERKPDFRCQRALMSGGTCEATAFALYGYRTTGLAFPLGNYHNATTRISDPDGGVDAEYIRLSDYLDGVKLIAEAAASVAKRNDSPTRRRLRQIPDDVRRRLGEADVE